jgi:hypothetical protein
LPYRNKLECLPLLSLTKALVTTKKVLTNWTRNAVCNFWPNCFSLLHFDQIEAENLAPPLSVKNRLSDRHLAYSMSGEHRFESVIWPTIRLCHPLDGSTSPKYKLLCFIITKKICKEKNALAFNWDRCCHLVLCLQLIPFHSLNLL